MERDYSWSFVPFQAVRVHKCISRQPSNRHEQKITQLTFAVRPRSSTRRQGCRHVSREQRALFAQRTTFHANIPQGKPQRRRCEPSKSHLRAKSRRYYIAIASRRRLLKFYDISSTFLAEIYRQSLVRRPVFSLVSLLVRPWPRRVTASAGEPFGAHVCPIPCSLCHIMPSHVHPYPHGPPANVATLPAPINCTYSRSKWAVRSG